MFGGSMTNFTEANTVENLIRDLLAGPLACLTAYAALVRPAGLIFRKEISHDPL